MAEVDAEILERVARWCAEAGRQAGLEEIRRALAPLAWDEQLRVRALLADAPPAQPLGPHALVDLARGVPADVAAERERAGQYRREDDDAAEAEQAPATAAPRKKPPRAKKGAALVIRRARDRVPTAEASAPRLPRLEELFQPEGRAVLEGLIGTHGARRAHLVTAVAAGWLRGDGTPPGEEELADLLEEHGLARGFERREKDELLHALRAAGGVLARAAEAEGVTPEAYRAALERLGAAGEAERIREERRAELRSRALLSERARLLLEDRPRLEDSGAGGRAGAGSAGAAAGAHEGAAGRRAAAAAGPWA
ncbi:MAG: hypothetical protein QM767_13715 [Anaeromyxobacter sp.]